MCDSVWCSVVMCVCGIVVLFFVCVGCLCDVYVGVMIDVYFDISGVVYDCCYMLILCSICVECVVVVFVLFVKFVYFFIGLLL